MTLLSRGSADFGVKNSDTIHSGSKSVTAAGTAEQLGSGVVPDGFSVVVKAKGDNTGKIYVADSEAEAEADGDRYELDPNEVVTLHVTNLNKIWLDAETSGNAVTFIVES